MVPSAFEYFARRRWELFPVGHRSARRCGSPEVSPLRKHRGIKCEDMSAMRDETRGRPRTNACPRVRFSSAHFGYLRHPQLIPGRPPAIGPPEAGALRADLERERDVRLD